MTNKGKKITRRQFIAKSAVGAAALTAGSSVLFSARSARAAIGSNERINVAVIGVGGMGGAHLGMLVAGAEKNNTRLAAVCDVYEPRKERALAKAKEDNPEAKLYHAYEDLLADPNIDAVWIATPDHWHAKIAMDALEAGKDVYCEKPMTHTWQEARDLYHTAERTGRVMQVGSQSCSDEKWGLAHELIQQGKIGQPIWGQTSWGRNSERGDWNYGIDLNSEKDIDWKRWLGPAPYRPFDPDRFFNFRKYWDYSGGIATDLFAHSLHAMCKAIGPHFPMQATAGGGIWRHDDREVADTFHMVIDYPQKYSIVALGSQANTVGLEVVIRGNEATMYLGSSTEIVLKPDGPGRGKRSEEHIPVENPRRGSHPYHYESFLNGIRNRDRRTTCPPELGYKVTVALSLAVDASRYKKIKQFDPVNEKEIV